MDKARDNSVRPELLEAGTLAAHSKLPPAAVPSQDDLVIGLDIESADNLPWSGDPSSEPFYAENFTRTEMAWCLRQPDPQRSFCGLWSAKEAAMKCGPELASLRPIDIEVLHDERGWPMLRIDRASLQVLARHCLLSISHSGKTSMAVCVRKARCSIPDAAPSIGTEIQSMD